jgi:hypothetical protein
MKGYDLHKFANVTKCDTHTILIARKMWCDKC